MYTEEMLESIKLVEAAREANAAMEPRRMSAEEKDQVLKENHPDYRADQFDTLSVGPNKGERAPKELVKLLQSDSRLKDHLPDLSCPDYETDVLIIGGGGAGASAAIEADEAGHAVPLFDISPSFLPDPRHINSSLCLFALIISNSVSVFRDDIT